MDSDYITATICPMVHCAAEKRAVIKAIIHSNSVFT
jgi:hypothetical protein